MLASKLLRLQPRIMKINTSRTFSIQGKQVVLDSHYHICHRKEADFSWLEQYDKTSNFPGSFDREWHIDEYKSQISFHPKFDVKAS